MWLRWLLKDLGVFVDGYTPLHCDNQSAIHIGKNKKFHERTKHIEIDCHFTRRAYLEGNISLSYIENCQSDSGLFQQKFAFEDIPIISFKLGIIVFSSS
jgi:hypothetical protein